MVDESAKREVQSDNRQSLAKHRVTNEYGMLMKCGACQQEQ
jgi:hypothetical protein